MKNYVIIADGTCDLNEDMLREFGIKPVLGHIHLPDGSEISQFLSWKDYTREDFYNKLKKNPNGYSTSPANPDMFDAVFREYAAQGVDMLVLTISGTMSGTYGFACKGREQTLKAYPNAVINVVDTLRFGPGFGLMAVRAAQLKAEGKSLAEVTQWLEDNKCRFHQAGWLDDLSFVAKKGRVNHAAALMGTIVGIKPIGEFDYNGMTTVLGKAKGAKKAYAVLLKYIAATIENPQEQMIFIAQTNRLAQAEQYKKMIEETIRPKEVRIVDVFPGSGINVGPGLMAAYYCGKPISKDLSEEKELINRFLNAAE